MYKSKEFESPFAEIGYAKKKHPKMCIDNFNNNFLYPLLDKVNKGKKTLLLMGDFNVNLLHSDSDDDVNTYLVHATIRVF